MREAAEAQSPPELIVVVDMIWSMALAGYLRPVDCRRIIELAQAAGLDMFGPAMDIPSSHKLVQARACRPCAGESEVG